MTTSLTTAEEVQLDKLVADAERNRKEAQQFAIEAGKLLAATTERLAEYKDRGFFKRCWYAISGKQSSLERANVDDLAKMQKFAWAYLMKLQEQNIIEAKAIAVIRNNLKDLQTEVGEIHDMVSQIVQKFDARVTKLEEVAALHDWVIHIQAQDGMFQKKYPAVCLVQLVFDYLSVLRRNNISFDSVENRDDLPFALKYFEIEPRGEYTIEDFISQLAQEVREVGFEKFKSIVKMEVGEKLVGYQEILDNVTGTGYNALYKFALEMDKMQNVLQFVEKEKVGDIMRKTVLASLNNGEVRYTALELGQEILGGSLIVSDVFSTECKPVGNQLFNEATGIGGFDIESLLGGYVTISEHPFLKSNPSEDEKRAYLESFALVYAGIGGFSDSNYLNAMAKLFNCESSIERVKLLSMSPNRIDVPTVIKTISRSQARKYIWCVDAMYVGQENGQLNARVKSVVLSMCKALGLVENEVSPFLENVNMLVSGNDPKSLFEAIKKIHNTTDAWKSIVDFKRISMKGAFSELEKKVSEADWAVTKMSLKVTEFITSGLGLSFNFDKTDYQIVSDRNDRVSAFNELRDNLSTQFKEFEDLLRECNSVRAVFSTPYIDCPLDISDIKCDEATNIENENWDDNMQMAVDKLSAALEKASTGFELYSEQFSLYDEGRFSESSAENRSKKAAEEKLKKARENEEKKTLAIAHNGSTIKMKAEFSKISGAPFDHSKVRSAVTFAGCWYVFADSLWRTADASSWTKVSLPEDPNGSYQLEVVNSTLFLKQSWSQEFFYSSDGLNFAQGKFPDNHTDYFILFRNDKWLLSAVEKREYTYKNGTGFFASDETGYCDVSKFFVADDLSAGWTETAELSLRMGDYLRDGSMFASERATVALSSVDTFYTDNMHIMGRGVRLLYAFQDEGWRSATYNQDVFKSFGDSVETMVSAHFYEWKNKLICIANGRVLTSPDGRVWESGQGSVGYGSDKFMEFGDKLIVTNGHDEVFVSLDGSAFSLLKLDHELDVVAEKDGRALVVETNSNSGGIYIMELRCS